MHALIDGGLAGGKVTGGLWPKREAARVAAAQPGPRKLSSRTDAL